VIVACVFNQNLNQPNLIVFVVVVVGILKNKVARKVLLFVESDFIKLT
jgi:hypothetical protein